MTTSTKHVLLTVELTHEHAQALANLTKRLPWWQISDFAKTPQEAARMTEALTGLKVELANQGFQPL